MPTRKLVERAVSFRSFLLLGITVWDYGLGLRFHTVYLKCRKIQKTLFTSLIVVNLSSSSILQVEQQKVAVFSPYFLILFMQRFVRYTVQLILSV